MKLALVISSLSAGGAERALSLLANHWSENDWEVTLISFSGDSAPFYKLSPKIKYIPLGLAASSTPTLLKPFRIFKLVSALKQVLRQENPDWVVSFMDQPNILTLLATRGSSFPVIVCEQIHPAFSSLVDPKRNFISRNFFRWFRFRIYHSAKRIVLLSPRSISYFPKSLQSRIVVIPNPAATPELEAVPVTIPAHTILSLGRLTRQKRFDLLIEAFSKIAPRYPELRLTIFGEGELRAALTQEIQTLGLTERVSLPGNTQAPYRALGQALFFVLSSDFEGFPLVLCEAMASGVPVIATDCPTGPAELIKSEHNGILVPPGDSAALAEAMARLAPNHELRTTLGQNAREILDQYGLKKIATRWEEIFRGA